MPKTNRVQPLEAQAIPLRWAFLGKLADIYPEKMNGLSAVAQAIAVHLEYLPGSEQDPPWFAHKIGTQPQNYEGVVPALRIFGEALNIHQDSLFSDDFLYWLDEAISLCAGHAQALVDPVSSVKDTVKDHEGFVGWGFDENPDQLFPEPPTYNPGVMTRQEYQSDVNVYIAAVETWHDEQGAVKVPVRTMQDKHLTWLSWYLVERLTPDQIVDRESGDDLNGEQAEKRVVGSDTFLALFRPGKLGSIIGLSRN